MLQYEEGAMQRGHSKMQNYSSSVKHESSPALAQEVAVVGQIPHGGEQRGCPHWAAVQQVLLPL